MRRDRHDPTLRPRRQPGGGARALQVLAESRNRCRSCTSSRSRAVRPTWPARLAPRTPFRWRCVVAHRWLVGTWWPPRPRSILRHVDRPWLVPAAVTAITAAITTVTAVVVPAPIVATLFAPAGTVIATARPVERAVVIAVAAIVAPIGWRWRAAINIAIIGTATILHRAVIIAVVGRLAASQSHQSQGQAQYGRLEFHPASSPSFRADKGAALATCQAIPTVDVPRALC